MLGPPRSAIGEKSFSTRRSIDNTTDRRPAAHLINAGVAGKAPPDRLGAGELFDPSRLGDKRPPERDEIGFSGGDRLGCNPSRPTAMTGTPTSFFTAAAKSRNSASGN